VYNNFNLSANQDTGVESLWIWGTNLTLAVQSLGSWLLMPMKLLSFLGHEGFFFLVLPLFFWCVDLGLGTRIGVNLLLTSGLNSTLKLLIHGPRPYWYSSRVTPYAGEISFGAPSGHAQRAVAVWGTIALWYKRTWVTVACLLIIFLISFSRVYLGVHFVHDVLLGWIFGGLLLWVVNRLWEPVASRVRRMAVWAQIALAFAASMGMILLAGLSSLALRGWTLPPEWLENATRAFPSQVPGSAGLSDVVTPAAVLFGLWSGLAWLNSRGGMDASGTTAQRIYRYLLGVAGVLILYLGLSLALPSSESTVGQVFRFIRYGLLGAWIAAGAPWLFIRLGLARPEPGR
jgi:membrane-associated phospholipid phosphatase